MRKIAVKLICVVLALVSASTAVADTKPPYWASVLAGEARMRTGPGRQFPASWLYQRSGLPVKVIAIYPSWRKVEDPDGTQGWMQANLLSPNRTGLVKGDVRPLRDKPSLSAKVIFRAEPGVVGRISDCSNGWCKLDVKGRMGYIETSHIWGAEELTPKP